MTTINYTLIHTTLLYEDTYIIFLNKKTFN